MNGRPRVCLGVITGAHGVRGQVRVRSFTDEPAAVAAYGPVEDEAGALRFRLAVTGRAKDELVARIDGVADRDAAEALRGTRLFVERAALPPPADPDEFYQADLVGLSAETVDGQALGRVVAVHEFGAGPLIEIVPDGGRALLVPFTRAVVPAIDLATGRMVVAPPEGLLGAGDEPAAERG